MSITLKLEESIFSELRASETLKVSWRSGAAGAERVIPRPGWMAATRPQLTATPSTEIEDEVRIGLHTRCGRPDFHRTVGRPSNHAQREQDRHADERVGRCSSRLEWTSIDFGGLALD
jgi:hypothetical protein